jgi:hypothetical protein
VIVTPHTPKLEAAVARLYQVFGTGHVSRQLEVCQCPVCMQDATRLQIIQTRTDEMPIDLIRAYTNSAHGVPTIEDDLRLLLPRYLDWISRDEMVDDIGVGTELLRFGDAKRALPDFLTAPQQAALDDWAVQVLWHFATADVHEMENLHTPQGLMETLLAGGWDVGLITRTLERIMSNAGIGQGATGVFLAMNQRELKTQKDAPKLDWFAIRYVDDATRTGLADWLNGAAFGQALEQLATDPNANAEHQIYARIMLDMQGQFTPQSFPQDRHG